MEGHIPGARFLDVEVVGADLSISGRGRHPLPSVGHFAESLGNLGVSEESIVILYDSDSGTIAARIWWMNRQLSIRSYIISGGIQSYSGPLESGEPHFAKSQFLPEKLTWNNSVTTDELIDLISENPKNVILDARNLDRYLGEFEPVDPRGGHIPGAYSLPTRTLMIDGKDPLSIEQIKERIKVLIGEETFEAIVDGDAQIVVSCGSGITACHLAIFVEKATGRPPILYDGSYSAWSTRVDLPVQSGRERGQFPSN